MAYSILQKVYQFLKYLLKWRYKPAGNQIKTFVHGIAGYSRTIYCTGLKKIFLLYKKRPDKAKVWKGFIFYPRKPYL
jgi:hypothetical protein